MRRSLECAIRLKGCFGFCSEIEYLRVLDAGMRISKRNVRYAGACATINQFERAHARQRCRENSITLGIAGRLIGGLWRSMLCHAFAVCATQRVDFSEPPDSATACVGPVDSCAPRRTRNFQIQHHHAKGGTTGC